MSRARTAQEFGDPERWLIQKSWDGWLLHEPITPDSSTAVVLPSFEAARQLFIAFTDRHSVTVTNVPTQATTPEERSYWALGETARLSGKAEGVRLALSYLEEYLR
jgi:hypothetical protein